MSPYVQYVNALVQLSEGEFTAAENTFDTAVAAGLSLDHLSDFLAALVVEGRFIQALQMRVRYSDANQG